MPRSITGVLPKVTLSYRGLFAPSMAPTRRAYCILFSFFFGVLELTAGSVFYHVISRHPSSGPHFAHAPPLALSIGLIIVGIITLGVTLVIVVRHGFDDGDSALEEDTKTITKDDVLDRRFQSRMEEVPSV